VSDKLTPEICINNASTNSRLTAAGRQAQPQIAIHRTVSRLSFFLPFFDETTTKLHLHVEKLTGQAVPNHRKSKSKKVESNLNLGKHNQTFKQLRQLNGRNHHIPISTNT
jgi:hypothetical protein